MSGTVTCSLVLPNRYLDSVALLRLSGEMLAVDGVTNATAVMATASNLAAAAEVGIETPDIAAPNDLFVGVIGHSEEACIAALALATERLSAGRSGRDTGGGDGERVAERARTLVQHARSTGQAGDLALISVPGPFAAAEARKALGLGMHVMMFSDNVDLADEVALKTLADERGLLVMGPDCGTAIVNGVPLGFANVVRRGNVGVIGASGTGMQEVIARVHRLGGGISQALGCGGRDLQAAVGGRTMLRALRLLATDADTKVIVLVSKPPAPEVLRVLMNVAGKVVASGKPVVAVFVGNDSSAAAGSGVEFVGSLAAAADRAVELAVGQTRPASFVPLPSLRGRRGGSVLRGAFVGGTFTYEAGHVLRSLGFVSSPAIGVESGPSFELIDFGDDDYTRGRPHPMIDPSIRDAWAIGALDDPSTAVVLVDVVLGHGATSQPVESLVAAIADRPLDRRPPIVAHVCGTELDPQNRSGVIASLHSVGVIVADSNVEAVRWAATIALEQIEV